MNGRTGTQASQTSTFTNERAPDEGDSPAMDQQEHASRNAIMALYQVTSIAMGYVRNPDYIVNTLSVIVQREQPALRMFMVADAASLMSGKMMRARA